MFSSAKDMGIDEKYYDRITSSYAEKTFVDYQLHMLIGRKQELILLPGKLLVMKNLTG